MIKVHDYHMTLTVVSCSSTITLFHMQDHYTDYHMTVT